MRSFSCSECRQLVFFENVACTRCGAKLAYLPDRTLVSAIAAEGDVVVALAPEAERARYRLCRSSIDHGACNWAVPEGDDSPYCAACRLNLVVPDLSDLESKTAWIRLEAAKRRLMHTLLALRLPIDSRADDPERGLAFSFMKQLEGSQPVFTGHSDGLITINVAEADDPFREKMRAQMGETYRTLVGHFRHEIGHYYWDRLIRDGAELPMFRELFGDERVDYQQALQRHYAQGSLADWSLSFVSAYAAMHPWEDWAETFAHYLHMVDALDTARALGVALRAKPIVNAGLSPVRAQQLDFDDFDDLITAWFPLTIALNSFNRGMGLPDLYPFVLGDRTVAKLRFVHARHRGEVRALFDEPRIGVVAPPAFVSVHVVRAGSAAVELDRSAQARARRLQHAARKLRVALAVDRAVGAGRGFGRRPGGSGHDIISAHRDAVGPG
jgi:hypothetical protein